MMNNLQTKTGTGTAVTFGYDENGGWVHIVMGAGVGAAAATGGAVSSATSYTGNYLSEKYLWQHDVKWDNGDLWAGVGKAAAIGAVSSGLMYGLSDR